MQAFLPNQKQILIISITKCLFFIWYFILRWRPLADYFLCEDLALYESVK